MLRSGFKRRFTILIRTQNLISCGQIVDNILYKCSNRCCFGISNIFGRSCCRSLPLSIRPLCQRLSENPERPFWHRWTNGRCFHCSNGLNSDAVESKRLADEKRLAVKKRKEAKRAERIEQQKQRLEKKDNISENQISVQYDLPFNPGEKKDVSCPLPETYSPQFVEAIWYDWWYNQGFFSPDRTYVQKSSSDNKIKKFVMCLPPPNVTGSLHLGHALGNAIQDAIARWHRMNGRAVLWNPGCDHAGIATQVVVEKELWKERGLRRQDIGREEFVAEVWKWKEEKGGRIYEQMKCLGSSLDWSRDCFTLDHKLSCAVVEAFVRLFDAGTIYRSRRLVNWSCALSSAISDIEVENLELGGKTLINVPGYERKIAFGLISSFSYPVDGSDEKIAVATTRLETMLGDTAIAVHPSDERYFHLRGKYVRHPFNHQQLPIVCDEMVDRTFGTGAVKVTPAHDRNDFEVGQRHNLQIMTVLAEDGTMINVPHEFKGMKRFDVKEKVRSGLEQLGLFHGSTDHAMSLPICSRSKDIVEMLLKDQWFVRCEQMAKGAIEAVESGHLRLIPEHYEKQWKDWLSNTRDWCISRQLWWGHRVPAYRVKQRDAAEAGTDLWVAARSSEEAIRKAAETHQLPQDQLTVEQDEDVLDTWFSSALFPFAIFGWPEKTSDLDLFYPTDLLETASDIMFFWVARMIMLGEALTCQLPFKEVLFHSVLRDAHGRKMSKSLGNVIDPMDVIHGSSLENLYSKLEKSNLDISEIKHAKAGLQRDFPLGIPECGADALRFALCSYNYTGHFVNVNVNHIKSSRHFCNKIWQSFRFISGHLDDSFAPIDMTTFRSDSATERWILSRLSNVVEICNKGFAEYKLMDVTKALHNFWWFEMCDVYLEYSKVVLQSGTSSEKEVAKSILYFCLESYLRLVSPFMPFLSEELYQRLPANHLVPRFPSIMVSSYPQTSQYNFRDEKLEKGMQIVKEIVAGLLSLRHDINVYKSKAEVSICSSDPCVRQAFGDHHLALLTLSRSETMNFRENDQSTIPGCISISGKLTDWTAHVNVKGLINVRTELSRLLERQGKLKKNLAKLEERSNDPRVAEEELIITQDKIKNISAELNRISNIVKALKSLNEH